MSPFLWTLVLGLAAGAGAFDLQPGGVKGGGASGMRYYQAAGNIDRFFGNYSQHGQANNAHNLSRSLDFDVGVCYVEVPTISLVLDKARVPAGNGSRPDLTRIRSCCKGYIRNIHNYRLCDPVCSEECVNGLCTAPEVCTCFRDHVRNLAGFCVATCPIGCQHGTCSGGECICKEGYTLDSEGQYCKPYCANGCHGLGNCTAPNTCDCSKGYVRSVDGSCKPVCENCQNGECVKPNTCACHRGYKMDERGICVPHCENDCGPGGRCGAPNVCMRPITSANLNQGSTQNPSGSLYPKLPSNVDSLSGQNQYKPNQPSTVNQPGQENYFYPYNQQQNNQQNQLHSQNQQGQYHHVNQASNQYNQTTQQQGHYITTPQSDYNQGILNPYNRVDQNKQNVNDYPWQQANQEAHASQDSNRQNQFNSSNQVIQGNNQYPSNQQGQRPNNNQEFSQYNRSSQYQGQNSSQGRWNSFSQVNQDNLNLNSHQQGQQLNSNHDFINSSHNRTSQHQGQYAAQDQLSSFNQVNQIRNNGQQGQQINSNQEFVNSPYNQTSQHQGQYPSHNQLSSFNQVNQGNQVHTDYQQGQQLNTNQDFFNNPHNRSSQHQGQYATQDELNFFNQAGPGNHPPNTYQQNQHQNFNHGFSQYNQSSQHQQGHYNQDTYRQNHYNFFNQNPHNQAGQYPNSNQAAGDLNQSSYNQGSSYAPQSVQRQNELAFFGQSQSPKPGQSLSQTNHTRGDVETQDVRPPSPLSTQHQQNSYQGQFTTDNIRQNNYNSYSQVNQQPNSNPQRPEHFFDSNKHDVQTMVPGQQENKNLDQFPMGVPQCRYACINSVCIEGNICMCNPGYEMDRTDPTASRCIPRCAGGCQNGVCTAPNRCICNQGYFKDITVKGRPMCVKKIR